MERTGLIAPATGPTIPDGRSTAPDEVPGFARTATSRNLWAPAPSCDSSGYVVFLDMAIPSLRRSQRLPPLLKTVRPATDNRPLTAGQRAGEGR